MPKPCKGFWHCSDVAHVDKRCTSLYMWPVPNHPALQCRDSLTMHLSMHVQEQKLLTSSSSSSSSDDSPMRTPETSPQSANSSLICSSVALQGRLPTNTVLVSPSPPVAAAVPFTSRRCFFLAAAWGSRGGSGVGAGSAGRVCVRQCVTSLCEQWGQQGGRPGYTRAL